jgi:hypothetical protein
MDSGSGLRCPLPLAYQSISGSQPEPLQLVQVILRPVFTCPHLHFLLVQGVGGVPGTIPRPLHVSHATTSSTFFSPPHSLQTFVISLSSFLVLFCGVSQPHLYYIPSTHICQAFLDQFLGNFSRIKKSVLVLMLATKRAAQ